MQTEPIAKQDYIEDAPRVTHAANGWWTRERLQLLALFTATAITFYLCYLMARPFFSVLAWALALAVVAHPLHEWIARRVAYPNLAAGLSVLIIAIIVIGPVILTGRRLTQEAIAGVETVNAQQNRWQTALARDRRLARAMRWVSRQIDLEAITTRFREFLMTQATSVVTGSFRTLAELLVTFFFLFYFFRDRRVVMRSLRSLVPLSEAEAGKVFTRIYDTIYATVYGSLVVALVQGALGGLMFWILGLPAPLLWGTVMAVLAIVPMAGTFLVWLPAALFLLLEGSWIKAVILLCWGALAISTIDNLLYPTLVGKRMRMHTVPVFISLVGGLVLFGAAGLILGPMLLAIGLALVDIWHRRTAGGRVADAVASPLPQ